CPMNLPMDFDGDGDVDGEDFGHLQACLTGVGGTFLPGCQDADLDGDFDVDGLDIAIFLGCLSGPHIVADTSCLP
ncbi:MAG: hypothetical protein HY718_05665, partial [Planctomycetes bacterium]|nr:hypothetical protein [Planctomycetota bacterium]